MWEWHQTVIQIWPFGDTSLLDTTSGEVFQAFRLSLANHPHLIESMLASAANHPHLIS